MVRLRSPQTSSVQKELKTERRTIKDFVGSDVLVMEVNQEKVDERMLNRGI